MDANQADLQAAVGRMRHGDLAGAERLCRLFLSRHPARSDALHLLGVVLLMRGDAAAAEEPLEAATRLDPGVAIAHYNHANALSALGRFEQAIACYERATTIRPDLAEAHCNRGNALARLGRWREAVDAYGDALRFRPELVDAHNNLGDALLRLGRETEALAAFEAALSHRPEHIGALNNRGNALRRLLRLHESLATYDRALSLNPGMADTLDNRGLVLQELGMGEAALASFDRALVLDPSRLGTQLHRAHILRELHRFEEAIKACDLALAMDPANADAFIARGIAKHEQRRTAEAIADFRQAIALRGDLVEGWNNLGNALHDLDRFEEARSAYDAALALRPDYAEAICNRGLVAVDERRFEEAIADFDRAIALRPGYSEAYKRRAIARLLRGEFATGWADYEACERHRRSRNLHRQLPIPRWQGESLAGKSILLSEPNGLGDTIMFFRYLRPMIAQGAKVTFRGPPGLFKLLGTYSDEVHFVTDIDEPASFDFQATLWTMPHWFRTGLHDVPKDIPYLKSEPSLVERWSRCLDPTSFNIGICWQGNPARKIDATRSIPLAHFQALADVPGVQLISLQKHHGLDQLGSTPVGARVQLLGDDFDEGPDAFLDTAAIMQGLDLVVSSDSVMGHLAGALGRPAWIGLRYVPEFRWMLDRADSPWYPSLRLFRQPAMGDWAPLFAAMADELRKIVGQPRG